MPSRFARCGLRASRAPVALLLRVWPFPRVRPFPACGLSSACGLLSRVRPFLRERAQNREKRAVTRLKSRFCARSIGDNGFAHVRWGQCGHVPKWVLGRCAGWGGAPRAPFGRLSARVMRALVLVAPPARPRPSLPQTLRGWQLTHRKRELTAICVAFPRAGPRRAQGGPSGPLGGPRGRPAGRSTKLATTKSELARGISRARTLCFHPLTK